MSCPLSVHWLRGPPHAIQNTNTLLKTYYEALYNTVQDFLYWGCGTQQEFILWCHAIASERTRHGFDKHIGSCPSDPRICPSDLRISLHTNGILSGSRHNFFTPASKTRSVCQSVFSVLGRVVVSLTPPPWWVQIVLLAEQGYL